MPGLCSRSRRVAAAARRVFPPPRGAGRRTPQAGFGGHVDYAAPASFQHQRDRGTRHEHGSGQVHAQHALPHRVTDLADGSEIVHDAGVVDQPVQVALGSSDDPGDIVLGADVAGNGHKVEVGVIAHQRVEAFLAQVGADDPATFTGNAEGDCLPDAGAGARDYHCLAVEPPGGNDFRPAGRLHCTFGF